MTAHNNSTTSTGSASITGRDWHIMNQALFYAIARIQSLPEERQERSDMHDMCLLARSLCGNDITYFLQNVEHHVGHKVDIYADSEDAGLEACSPDA